MIKTLIITCAIAISTITIVISINKLTFRTELQTLQVERLINLEKLRGIHDIESHITLMQIKYGLEKKDE